MHPRSKHGTRYDIGYLAKASPDLLQHVKKNAFTGEDTIEFSKPESVFELNKALLVAYYNVDRESYSLPPGYLCPAIPSRANYVHYVADLLSSTLPVLDTSSIKGIDISTGASGVYPLIGHSEYKWHFHASDIDETALENARRIFQKSGVPVQLHLQQSRDQILQGILTKIPPEERLHFSMCNPPFHASQKDAEEATTRKWRNLNKKKLAGKKTLNFGGNANELWCEGGEVGFIAKMIKESAAFHSSVCWYTSLVSSENNLPRLIAVLENARAVEYRTVCMEAGSKSSHLLAWTFVDKDRRKQLFS